VPDPLGGLAYTWPLYITALVAYLIGSIPFGMLLARLAGHGDIREIGSGNIGATNVLRTGNKRLAALTLLLDAGKGWFSTRAAGYWGPDAAVVAGLFAVLGHMFPVWLRFRGGKGVATVLGVIAALAWPVALASALAWLAMAALFRFSSLASMVSIVATPPLLAGMLWLQRDGDLPYWLPGESQHIELFAMLAVLVLLRHHGNIRRLITGQEPRIGRHKD